jgi:hypothetical protein
MKKKKFKSAFKTEENVTGNTVTANKLIIVVFPL